MRFQPGVSGNPKGSKKGRTVGDSVKRVLRQSNGKLRKEFAQSLVREAIKGSATHARLVMEYDSGKPLVMQPDPVDAPISREENARRLASLLRGNPGLLDTLSRLAKSDADVDAGKVEAIAQ